MYERLEFDFNKKLFIYKYQIILILKEIIEYLIKSLVSQRDLLLGSRHRKRRRPKADLQARNDRYSGYTFATCTVASYIGLKCVLFSVWHWKKREKATHLALFLFHGILLDHTAHTHYT